MKSDGMMRVLIQRRGMKKPWVALLCNFLLAGAGFVYLGKWKWAVADFLITMLLGVALYRFFPNSFSWITAAIPATNGLLAMNMTRFWNARTQKV